MAYRSPDRPGIEAILQGQVSRQGVENPLLRLYGDDRAPFPHQLRPLDGMHADIGTTVQGNHTIPEMIPAALQYALQDIDVPRVIAAVFEDLSAYTVEIAVEDVVVVHPVHEHRPVIG